MCDEFCVGKHRNMPAGTTSKLYDYKVDSEPPLAVDMVGGSDVPVDEFHIIHYQLLLVPVDEFHQIIHYQLLLHHSNSSHVRVSPY